jgi:hypothetical protein
MKTAVIPPVRVLPAVRQAAEDALCEGETLAAFVEKAVQAEVARREGAAAFVARGLAAIDRSERTGDWLPAAAVLSRLEARLAAARQR